MLFVVFVCVIQVMEEAEQEENEEQAREQIDLMQGNFERIHNFNYIHNLSKLQISYFKFNSIFKRMFR